MNLINLFPLTVIKDKIEIAEKDRNLSLFIKMKNLICYLMKL